ncbi:MAG: hypothetical protein AB1489_42395, partial [Acidobacteriota bacterium]
LKALPVKLLDSKTKSNNKVEVNFPLFKDELIAMSLNVNESKNVTTRESFRTELEAIYCDYYRLLNSFCDRDWHFLVPHPRRFFPKVKVGALMLHISVHPKLIPEFVDGVRKGKGFANYPKFAFSLLEFFVPRLTVFKDTRASVAEKYDQAHQLASEVLDSIEEHEWNMGANFLGDYWTLRKVFHFHREHFDDHASQIRRALSASKGFQG